MNIDNLLPLKDDMVAFIEGHGLKRLPGYVTEDIPSIIWEGDGNPDSWKDFVEMAKHAGAPFVTFSEMTLEREEIEALIEEAGEMNFPDEESSELVEAQWLRKYAGNLGYIQLGFVYQGVAFLHETTTEWYERFQGLLEDIETFQELVIGDARSRRRGRVSAVGAEGNGPVPRPAVPQAGGAGKWPQAPPPALELCRAASSRGNRTGQSRPPAAGVGRIAASPRRHATLRSLRLPQP